ncbi:DNA repair protein RecO [Nisaea acidiphila]|uniref:DNA repair protein RecO n=1 Tax=Nisaea acidiphila TaxID=1862145 RepID=A0A9J7AS08_9PROT|nr:DNA repair protein RecO [Nisaea acidiphila]UUX50411.1 DNA repair protein RecO [Nisaea acidiphila]
MEWTDDGIVLSVRPHGETGAIVVLLTEQHGRHAGLVRGGSSSKQKGILQPGNAVRAVWRARLAEQLGSYTLELDASHAAAHFDDPLKLSGLTAVCAVADRALPEREPHPAIHAGFLALIDAMGNEALGDLWIAVYVRWELGLLAELGYGLDLSECAATGSNDDLAYVSPRTGRAVSLSAGEPYRDRMLPMPDFLIGRGGGDFPDLLKGLDLTGHFLEKHLFNTQGEQSPAPRTRFRDRIGGHAASDTMG